MSSQRQIEANRRNAQKSTGPIHCEWLLRRYRTAETEMWKYQDATNYSTEQQYPLGKSATGYSTSFSKLQYRVDATRRAYQRALKALKELRAEAALAPAPVVAPDPPSVDLSPQTTSPQIGFVLPTPSIEVRPEQFDPFPSPTGSTLLSRNLAPSNGLY